MALYNKNGTVYKLRSPNPVMKSQEIWEEFKVHNMEWQDEKAEDTSKVDPISSDFQVKNTFLQDLDDAKEEIKVVEKPIEQEKEYSVVDRTPVVKVDEKRQEELSNDGIEKTFIHCLPAKIRQRRDDLYGETYNTIQYEKPTSFEGVIIKQEDLMIEIWTDVDKIEAGSILYPKSNFKRWWKVQNKESKAGGWLLTAMISEYQPSFDF
jgi:hypothetical protein